METMTDKGERKTASADCVNAVVHGLNAAFYRGGIEAFLDYLLATADTTVTHADVSGTKPMVPGWEFNVKKSDKCTGFVDVYRVNTVTKKWGKARLKFSIHDRASLIWMGPYVDREKRFEHYHGNRKPNTVTKN